MILCLDKLFLIIISYLKEDYIMSIENFEFQAEVGKILNIVANSLYSEKEIFISDLMSKMTLDEKVGQMNQYNGFWDATGPLPKKGYEKGRYDDLRNGLVGSMLNVTGVKNVSALQKIAVEETRLGIPLIFGFDVIHGYKTISPELFD